jgi:hypothetical protein
MTNEYEKFGTLKYRSGRNSLEAKIGWIGLRDAHKHVYVWEDVDSVTGETLKGLGYPVCDASGKIVNFLKISLSGPLNIKESYIEESFEPGRPIANCHVRFGKRTEVILVTVDCVTAMVLRLATGLGTVAALYPSNLKAICLQLRERNPDIEIKVCVNGDGGRDKENISFLEAHDAADAIGAKICTSGLTTFSDLQRRGPLYDIQEELEGKKAWRLFHDPAYSSALKIAGLPGQWPHRIGGSSVLLNLMHSVRSHVSMPDDLALIVGLWVMHTYGIAKVRFSPLLAIMSPEYIEGTKTLLDVLCRVCRLGYKTSAITKSQLLKLINPEQWLTLLFDDGDALFRSQDFVHILKTSHDRTAGGITTSTRSKRGGESISAKSVFFAKASTSSAGLPKPIASLAIPIQLHRKGPNEQLYELPPFDLAANDEFSALRTQMVRWWQDHAAEVDDYRATDLDLGSDQAHETYNSLFAIASAIGPDTLQRAVAAVMDVLAQEDIKSDGVRLLENLSDLLKDYRHDNIYSQEVTDLLNKRDDWLWATYPKGKPLTQTILAVILKPYGPQTASVRVDGGPPKRGYHLSDLRDAFALYVRHDGHKEDDQEHAIMLPIEVSQHEFDEVQTY